MAVVINGSAGVTTNSGAIYNGIQSATPITVSGTSVDFTNVPSWVKRITIMFNGVSLNGNDEIMVQIGTGGTPTTTGYAGRVAFAGISAGTTAFSSGFIVFVDSSAADLLYGQATLCLISGNNWTYTGSVGMSNIAYNAVGGGAVSLSGTLNLVRITTTNGTDTFDAGTINILYE